MSNNKICFAAVSENAVAKGANRRFCGTVRLFALTATVLTLCFGSAAAQDDDVYEYAVADSAYAATDSSDQIERWRSEAVDDDSYAEALEAFLSVEDNDYEDYLWYAGVMYYGFTAREEYDDIYECNDALAEFIEMDDKRQAFDKSQELLERFPACLKMICWQTNICTKLGIDEQVHDKLEARYHMLLELIWRCGDGTLESPYIITNKDDAYNFLHDYLDADKITDITDVETHDWTSVQQYAYTSNGESHEAYFDWTYYDDTLLWWDDEDSDDDSDDDGDVLWPLFFLF